VYFLTRSTSKEFFNNLQVNANYCLAWMNVGLAGARGVSSCDSYGKLCASEWYASKDGGPTTRCRSDGQFSVYQTEPLPHADQA